MAHGMVHTEVFHPHRPRHQRNRPVGKVHGGFEERIGKHAWATWPIIANDDMKKQQKYSIVMDLQNRYSVVLRYTGIAVYQSENRGQAGLEDCQDWLAKQPED